MLSRVEKNIRHARDEPALCVARFEDQSQLTVQLRSELRLISLCLIRSVARGFRILRSTLLRCPGECISPFGFQPRDLCLFLCDALLSLSSRTPFDLTNSVCL
jgi:hypothetical protein